MWLIKHYRSAAAAAIHNRYLTVGGAGLALALIMVNVAMAPIGGLLALLLTHTNFSVSSGVGFLALFGVSVQTGVIVLEYINQLSRAGSHNRRGAIEGAVLRLRPIMMTMLVATTGHKLVRHTTTCMRGASGIFGSGWSLRSGRRTGAAPHWRAAL